jgi:hypothetical protein
MTPDQSQRSAPLKRRNLRRLQRPLVEQSLRELGFNPSLVADSRTERLLAGLRSSFRSESLVEEAHWTEQASQFAAGRFGLTIMRLWDWDGDMPMFRVAAASVERSARQLGGIFSSGFALIDDDDRHTLVVDLDFDEDEQKLVGRLAEIDLEHAED